MRHTLVPSRPRWAGRIAACALHRPGCMSRTVENASLPELVRALADDARELVRAEVGLAKDELGKTLRVLLIVLAGATAATVIAVFSVATFLAAAVLGAGGSSVVALLTAAGW